MFEEEPQRPTIDGIEAPLERTETTAEAVGRFGETLEAMGIAGGLAGLVFIVLGLISVGVFYWLAWRLASIAFARYTEGQVIGAEYAPGGRFTPVIRYTDKDGRHRQWVADMATASDPTGMPVRLRIDGERPEIVSEVPPTGYLIVGLAGSILCAVLFLLSGFTGRLFGIVPFV